MNLSRQHEYYAHRIAHSVPTPLARHLKIRNGQEAFEAPDTEHCLILDLAYGLPAQIGARVLAPNIAMGDYPGTLTPPIPPSFLAPPFPKSLK